MGGSRNFLLKSLALVRDDESRPGVNHDSLFVYFWDNFNRLWWIVVETLRGSFVVKEENHRQHSSERAITFL